jgi:hypothetical protein
VEAKQQIIMGVSNWEILLLVLIIWVEVEVVILGGVDHLHSLNLVEKV